jgi:cellulose synthase/poly-beta-1,6-N-acetylglucosamine synthase-like glycosyltransferase
MAMEIIFYGVQIILTIFTFYYFVVSLFGFYRRQEDYSLPPGARFAVVVAAHNESKVIGELIRNLYELNYPKELYDIYVVADNCSDNTADIAGEKGAYVIERFNKKEKGKGQVFSNYCSILIRPFVFFLAQLLSSSYQFFQLLKIVLLF